MRILLVSALVVAAGADLAHSQDRSGCPAFELAELRAAKAAQAEGRRQSDAINARLADLRMSAEAVIPSDDLFIQCPSVGAPDSACLDGIQLSQRQTASKEFGRWLGDAWLTHPTDTAEYNAWLMRGFGALMALRAEIARQALSALDKEETALATEARILRSLPLECG